MRKVIALLASFMTFIVILVGCKSRQDSYKQILQIVKNTNEAIENTKASKQIHWWDKNWNHGEVCGYTCSEIVGNDPHYRCEKDPRLEWLFRHVK